MLVTHTHKDTHTQKQKFFLLRFLTLNSDIFLAIISQNSEKIKQNCFFFIIPWWKQASITLSITINLSICGFSAVLQALLCSSGMTEWGLCCNSWRTLFLKFTHSTAFHLEFGQIRRFGSTEGEKHRETCFLVHQTHVTLCDVFSAHRTSASAVLIYSQCPGL